jgi:hypothetical protein
MNTLLTVANATVNRAGFAADLKLLLNELERVCKSYSECDEFKQFAAAFPQSDKVEDYLDNQRIHIPFLAQFQALSLTLQRGEGMFTFSYTVLYTTIQCSDILLQNNWESAALEHQHLYHL